MAVAVNTSLESASLKKSIILKPENQGDVKVVLVKCYLSSGGKEEQTETAFTKADAPTRASKRKSFEMVDSKEVNEQCLLGKRRRSVQLTETMKPTVALVQDLEQNHNSSLGSGGDVYHMPQSRDNTVIQALPSNEYDQPVMEILPSTHTNESFDFPTCDNQDRDKLVDDFQDCVLLPNWLDNRNTECLVDSRRIQLDEHKSLFSLYDLDLPQVKNNGKFKSLFETYNLNKVYKSIVDEI